MTRWPWLIPGSAMTSSMNRFGSGRVQKFPRGQTWWSRLSPKVMITAVCHSAGFHGICLCPKRCRFSSSCCQSGMIESLSGWRSGHADSAGPTLIIRTDNARTHIISPAESQQFMEEDRVARAPYSLWSYSLGSAPSDFYLFGHMKYWLGRWSF
jgi:hypothetical protein